MSAGEPLSISWTQMNHRAYAAYGSLFILAIDVVLYPTELLTTRLQANSLVAPKSGIGRMLSHMYRRDGLRAIGSFPGQFIYYVAYERSSVLIRPHLDSRFSPSTGKFLTCAAGGAVAVAASAFAYLPSDIITQRLQVHSQSRFLKRREENNSALKTARHVYSREGVGGFFRGYGAYMATYGPYSAIWWVGYELARSLLEGVGSRSHLRHELDIVLGGCFAGALTAIFINPLEVAKTRMQLMETDHKGDAAALRAGFRKILVTVYRREGINGLFKGLKQRLLFKAPGGAITMWGYEYIKALSLAE